MADDKTKQDGRDDTRVDVHDRNEVRYFHQQYPNYTNQQIVEAIKKYGPIRKNIVAKLKKDK
jgi:hypothetical protein